MVCFQLPKIYFQLTVSICNIIIFQLPEICFKLTFSIYNIIIFQFAVVYFIYRSTNYVINTIKPKLRVRNMFLC